MQARFSSYLVATILLAFASPVKADAPPSKPGIPLSEVDPATNSVVRQWVGAGGDSLPYGHGSLWLTDYDGGTVVRIVPPPIGMP